jgi:type II secretory pathway pseudopilin PulG
LSRTRVLIAVIVAIVMISTIVAAMAQKRREKEQALMRDMASAVSTLRTEISDFRKQRGRYPHTLKELPQIPRDPVTGSPATWQLETEQSVSADDFTAGSKAPETFVVDVHSGAKGRDANGRAWSDY